MRSNQRCPLMLRAGFYLAMPAGILLDPAGALATDDVVPQAERVVDFGAGNDTVNIVNGPLVAGVPTLQINSPSLPEPLNLANKVLIRVRTMGGEDSVTLNYTNPGTGNQALVIEAATGNDTITVTTTAGSMLVSIDAGDEDDIVAFSDHTGNGGTLVGGAGTDLLTYVAYITPVTVDLSAGTGTGFIAASGFENVTGGGASDTLTGDAQPNVLIGGAGNDTLRGLGAADQLVGGTGGDSLEGGPGIDQVQGDANADTLIWRHGDENDTFEGGSGADTLEVHGSADAGDVFAVGIAAGLAQVVRTNLVPVTLNAATVEAVRVFGGGGADTLQTTDLAGALALTAVGLNGDDGNDILDGSGLIAGSIDKLELNGGAGDDTLIGSEADDEINAGDGNDQITPGRGEDQVTGGRDADRMIWANGDGTDIFDGQAGSDRVDVSGSPSGDDAFVIAANGSRVTLSRTNLTPFSLDLGTIETIAIDGLDGDETMTANVDLSSVIDLAAINFTGGEGDDVFSVLAQANVAFTIDGGPQPAADLLNVDLAGRVVTLTANTIAAAGRQPVTHTNIENVTTTNVAPNLSVSDAAVGEDDGTAVFTLSLSAISSQVITVAYATADGAADGGNDYASASGTATFAPGSTSTTVTVFINDDDQAEANEDFLLQLSNPVNANLIDSSGTGTIFDNDPLGGGSEPCGVCGAGVVIPAMSMIALFAAAKARRRR